MVSKSGIGYGTCGGCGNHRPLMWWGPRRLGGWCRACYCRVNSRAVYFPEENLPLFTWGLRKLATK